MLGFLFEQYDEDGDGQIDVAEFRNLALDMIKACFVFNGGEALDTLSITQVDVSLLLLLLLLLLLNARTNIPC